MTNFLAFFGQDDVLQKGKPPREEDCVDKGSFHLTLKDVANRAGNPDMVNFFPEGYVIARRQHLNAWLLDHSADFARGKAYKARIPGATVYAHFGGWKLVEEAK